MKIGVGLLGSHSPARLGVGGVLSASGYRASSRPSKALGWLPSRGKGREGKGREGKGREGKGREGFGFSAWSALARGLGLGPVPRIWLGSAGTYGFRIRLLLCRCPLDGVGLAGLGVDLERLGLRQPELARVEPLGLQRQNYLGGAPHLCSWLEPLPSE